MSVLKKSAAEQAKALAVKEISASELVKAHYEQIKAVDKDVKAFLYLDEKNALAQAEQIDKKRAISRSSTCVKRCNGAGKCANNLWLKNIRRLASTIRRNCGFKIEIK
jgi:hypothetical protein